MKALHTIKAAMAAAVFTMAAGALSSCASKRVATDETAVSGKKTSVSKSSETAETRKLAFVQKVSDNAVYAKDITAKMDFTLSWDGKSISADGTLRMRKDEVIRIQLSLLGLMEVGRIELTPEYVMVIDRVHKEYIKAGYDKVAFLQRNGLDFYTLQALFWNKLFLPGQQSVSEENLRKYDAGIDETGENVPVKLSQGNLQFVWNANRQSGRIDLADITYTSKATGTASVSWKYADFKALGAKMFPNTQTITLHSPLLKKYNGTSANLKMSSISTKSDWDAKTEVSGKYKQVDAEDIIKKIFNL